MKERKVSFIEITAMRQRQERKVERERRFPFSIKYSLSLSLIGDAVFTNCTINTPGGSFGY